MQNKIIFNASWRGKFHPRLKRISLIDKSILSDNNHFYRIMSGLFLSCLCFFLAPVVIISQNNISVANEATDFEGKENQPLTQEEFFKKINRSFDILGAVYKEVAINYLIDVDPELLMDKAIRGMLNNLDPYTVYYTSDEETLTDQLNRDEYIGFGITISIIDSTIYVNRVKAGYGAEIAGFKPGDIIHEIDGIKLYGMRPDSISNYTHGNSGTVSNVVLIRDGKKISTIVERMEITDPAVPYYGMLDSGVGYISLERFSSGSALELKQALRSLDKANDLNGLVIDLRGNSGGLLNEAVQIAETFVPLNSEIVSTKGRLDVEIQTYQSLKQPEYGDLRLAIIVDEQSASASEVIAGAIQDLDRGIIVGKQTFGKGLVQTYSRLPHGAKLKITTANYFTPSGRSIQKLDIEKLVSNQERRLDDTLIFTTVNGRVLSQFNGVMPDTLVNGFNLPNEYLSILSPRFVFEFITRNVVNTSDFGLNSEIDDNLVYALIESVDFDQLKYALPNLEYLLSVDEQVINNELGADIDREVNSAKERILISTKERLKKRKSEIKQLLKIELLRRNLNLDEYLDFVLANDNVISTAADILDSHSYINLLSNGSSVIDTGEEAALPIGAEDLEKE